MAITFITKQPSADLPPGKTQQQINTLSGKTLPDSKTGIRVRNDLQPKLKIMRVSISSISPASNSVRKVSKQQVGKIATSIKTFGVRNLPLLDGALKLIDGQAIVEACKSLGLKDLDCIIADDLNDTEIRALRIARNKLQEGGAWDEEALRLEFTHLLDAGVELELTGFEVPEIDRILILNDDPASDEESDPHDLVPGLQADAVTEPGDLWKLGRHRVLCGNARKSEDLKVLLGNTIVDAVFTDPPYNVPISGHVTVSGGEHPEFMEASGEMSEKEFQEFLRATITQMKAVLKPDGITFLCMDWRHTDLLMEVLKSLGFELLNICVWAKQNPGMGSFYRSQHEFVVVAKPLGSKHQNNIQLGKFGRNRSNLWSYAGATGGKAGAEDDFSVHPTVKPVRLVRDAILDATSLKSAVLDPFLGSGTTVLACERAGRTCFGMDLCPHYVDVAIRRWQDVTGLKAVHATSGLSFDEVSDLRTQAAAENPAQDHSPAEEDS